MNTPDTRSNRLRARDDLPPGPVIERLTARTVDMDGISVCRLLPTRQRRMIGAWCFLDHAGPAVFGAGSGMRVGAHPHTSLQTLTWMIDGEVLHRDSLGNVQVIRPGQVNLMTAGRGIAHSEESLPDQRCLHAAQLWIALPSSTAACDPAFDHYPLLPRWDERGCSLTLLAGEYEARLAPARVYSPLIGMEMFTAQGASLDLSLRPAFEYGVLPLAGEVSLGLERFACNELAYLREGADTISLELTAGSRILLLGGEPFADEILMWWNFVGFSRAEIVEAQCDWESGSSRFGHVEGFDGIRLLPPPLPWA